MPKKPDRFYWDVLRDAWHIAWHHKHLWFFGFFATMLGFGGGADLFLRVYDANSSFVPAALAGNLRSAFLGMTTVRAIIAASPFPALTLVLMIAALIVIGGLFVWLTTVSVTALVAATRKIHAGGDVHLIDGIRIGHRKFWTVFTVNFAAKIVLGIAIAITSLSLFVLARDLSLVSGVFYLATFLVFTLIALVAAIAAIFATNYAIIRNSPFPRALREGIALVGRHWLICVETVLVLLLASIAIAAIVALVVLMLFVPIMLLFIFAAYFRDANAVDGLSILSAVILVSFAFVLSAFLTTFQTAAWTLLWTRLNDNKGVALLSRVKRKISQMFEA